jgi:hypothetical protein
VAVSGTTLVDQPRGKGLECRAVAVSKAGGGEASNAVLAVLYLARPVVTRLWEANNVTFQTA